MKTLLFPCLLLIYLLSISPCFSQPFVQTYHDFEPDPNGNSYFFNLGTSSTIESPWAAIGALNGYDENGNNLVDGAGAVYIYYRN
ncbi:MAG: hypothetical protein AAF399_06450, partial [Bacteroidota bacterium]